MGGLFGGNKKTQTQAAKNPVVGANLKRPEGQKYLKQGGREDLADKVKDPDFVEKKEKLSSSSEKTGSSRVSRLGKSN